MPSSSPSTNTALQEPAAKQRDPSTLFYQSNAVRRFILIAYWAVIILALPLWWKTTSIERLSLPSSRVQSQAGKELSFPIHLRVKEAALARELQSLLEVRKNLAPERWKDLRLAVSKFDADLPIPGTYTITERSGSPLVGDRHLYHNIDDGEAFCDSV